MSENEQTDTVTVTDMSPVDQLINFCLDNNIQRTVIEELIERGFDSLTALSLIDGEDVKSQKIPVGQCRLVLHIAKSLKEEPSGGSRVSSTPKF